MTSYRTGIDRRGNAYCLARVMDDGSRPRVVSIRKADSPETAHEDTIAFSIPDDRVLVKSLYLPETTAGSVPDRARFEIQQALLDDPSSFETDLLPSFEKDRYLGLVIRRSDLAQMRDLLCNGNDQAVPGVRSVALARGYRTFCRMTGGDLVCLVDFVDGLASIALLYRSHIATVAHLKLAGLDLSSENDCRRTAIELKTVVNFRLAALSDQGISVPLSKLLLVGEEMTEEAVAMLGKLFTCGVQRPEFNMAFFDGLDEASDPPSDSCLTALGLALN